MKYIPLIFLTILFWGCAKTPVKEDIEDLVESVAKDTEKPEEEKGCGNQIVEDKEECDFQNNRSCSEFDDTLIGPAECTECKLNLSSCTEKSTCRESICDDNADCIEEKSSYEVKCLCKNNTSGPKCEKCATNFHRDLDGTCISNAQCTEIGCEHEKQECLIITNQAECRCIHPWIGETCNRCNSDYYLEDGECVGRRCYNSDIQCSIYEKCYDYQTDAECICKSKTQDPENCEKCLSGYDMDLSEAGVCINKKSVKCTTDPDKPSNTDNIYQNCDINYSESQGWSECYCDWKFSKTMEIFKVLKNNNNEVLMFKRNGEIYKYSGSDLTFIMSLPYNYIEEIKILPDGNFFLIYKDSMLALDAFIVLTTSDGKEIFKKMDLSRQKDKILTFTQNGRIFQGKTEHTLSSDLIKYPSTNSSGGSIALIDRNGNTYTIFEDGVFYSLDNQKNLRWENDYKNTTFSLASALTLNSKLLIPYMKPSNQSGVFIINTDDGVMDSIMFVGDGEYMPALTVGDSAIFIQSDTDGRIYKFLKDGELLNSEFVSFVETDASPMIITDEGYIYLIIDGEINKLDSDLNQIWGSYSSSQDIYYVDGKIFGVGEGVYVAKSDGHPVGDWPHYLHDPMQSGSLEKIEPLTPPKAATLVSPSDLARIQDDEVTLSWEIDTFDSEVKYALMMKETNGLFLLIAGPKKGLNTYTFKNINTGVYNWKVISQDESGALNVSDTYNFLIE